MFSRALDEVPCGRTRRGSLAVSRSLNCRYLDHVFRRDRRTTRTDSPSRIPAAIDSNGKPGTAGTTRGVVMLVAEDAVTVMRLRATDVLVESWVVVDVDV